MEESIEIPQTTTTVDEYFKDGHCQVSKSRGTPFNLYYQLHGKGEKKLMMIMGFLTGWEGWKLQIEEIKKYQDEYQMCVFDNRGVGLSETPSYNYSSSHMAKDALDLMDHLGWDKAHVVGVSMGGMISLELAASAPHRVQTLALCVTHAGGFGRLAPMSGIFTMLKSFTIKDHHKRGRVLMPILYSEKYLKQLDDNGIANIETCINNYVTDIASKKLPLAAAVAGHIKTVTTHHITDRRLRALRDTKIPILIMCGDIDHLVRTSNSFLLRDILEPSEFIQFNSGHCINVEHKQEFNDALFRNFNRYNNNVQEQQQQQPPQQQS